MIVHGLNSAAAAYAAPKTPLLPRQTFPSSSASYTDQVSISDAAKAMLANAQASASEQEINNRLDTIKAKPGVERTAEDTNYLSAHDQRFAAIQGKIKTGGMASLTSDEVDYLQKATGFVNTMAELSPNEKALYDELVAQGKGEAAQGLLLIGMSRMGMGGQQVTLPNGRVFDPAATEVTAGNLRNLFKQMFVDASGGTDRQFEALASYLDHRQAAGGATGKV